MHKSLDSRIWTVNRTMATFWQPTLPFKLSDLINHQLWSPSTWTSSLSPGTFWSTEIIWDDCDHRFYGSLTMDTFLLHIICWCTASGYYEPWALGSIVVSVLIIIMMPCLQKESLILVFDYLLIYTLCQHHELTMVTPGFFQFILRTLCLWPRIVHPWGRKQP